jgi:hypothetical protein
MDNGEMAVSVLIGKHSDTLPAVHMSSRPTDPASLAQADNCREDDDTALTQQ